MARIKSAWEIALEKTADIQMDEKKYNQTKLEKEGMALVGKFLNSAETPIDEIMAKLSEYNPDDLEIAKGGMVKSLLSNIALPKDELYEMRFDRTCTLLCSLAPQNMEARQLLQQIGSFFSQYIQHKKDFVQRMQDQITQARQQDPENFNGAQYAKLIEQNLQKLDDQYSGAFEDTMAQLKQMLGIAEE